MLEILAFIIGAGTAFWAVGSYNAFIKLRNAIEATYGQIKVAMKKRLDKISRLVDTVGSYVKFEKDVHTEIAKLRSMAMETPEDLRKADAALRGILGTIKVAVENYPDLKAKDLVMKLMEEVDSIEDEIGRLRYLYNDQVQKYNTMAEVIPTNIIASIGGFRKQPYLEFEESIEKPPETKFY